MSRKKSYGISVGTSSILVIIVILSLVCFAGLSVVSANADYQLSRKLADRTTTYYDAVSQAHEDLAKIKEPVTDSLTFSYDISDTQSLLVKLEPINSSTESDRPFTISRFQIVTTNEPELDTSLPVFLGN